MQARLHTLVHIANHLGVVLASKFVPLASILVYSRFMTVEDYGVVNVFSSYIWIFGILMTLNLHTAIGRYIYDREGDFGSFLGTSLLAIGGVYTATAILVAANLDAFAGWLRLPQQVIVLLLIVVLGQVAESMFMQVAIYHERSALLLKVTAARAFATLAITITLLLVLEHDKYRAVLWADAFACAIVFGYVMFTFRREVVWAWRADLLSFMARYSVPLIPYMLSLTLLSQFDRVMIDHFFGKQATGLYSLAYNVGILLIMVATALLNTFNPAFFDAMNRGDHAKVVRDAGSIYSLAVLCTAVLVLFGQDAASLVLSSEYAPAFDIIPVIAIGGLASVSFQIWGRVIGFAKQTWLLAAIAVIATVVKLGLNYWMLPLFGYKAAAATTVLAYALMSLLCIAAVNYRIRLLRVGVAAELGYLVGLGMLAWALDAAEIGQSTMLSIKAVLLLLAVWHFRDRLVALLHIREVRLAGA